MKNKNLRFIISGGGTGGHLFPAIAIANKLKSLYPDSEIMFVGSKGKIEMEKVPLSGYPIKGLWISGFQRNNMWRNVLLPLKLIHSFIISFFLVKKIKPHVAIGTGGYASFPLLFVASKLKIPTLIQEQNFFPGISNKLLARSVKRICTVYPGMEKYFPAEKIVITGNPIREDIRIDLSNKAKYYEAFGLNPDKKVLLVLGGSLGAKSINEALQKHYESFIGQGMQIIWQAGRYYNELKTQKDWSSVSGLYLKDFIHDMTSVYTIADLVVSRAGAITISELAVMEKACVLVPSPNVTEDHQTKNALALVEKKAALFIKDNEVNLLLPEIVNATVFNDNLLRLLSENIKQFAQKQSTNEISAEIIKLIRKNES